MTKGALIIVQCSVNHTMRMAQFTGDAWNKPMPEFAKFEEKFKASTNALTKPEITLFPSKTTA